MFCQLDDKVEMGSKYLRECESAAHAQMLLRQKLFKHGTTDVSFNNLQCDYDGSYGKYKIENGMFVESFGTKLQREIIFFVFLKSFLYVAGWYQNKFLPGRR